MSVHAGYETLDFHRDGEVLTLKLNRPESRNAVNAVMHDELSRVFREIARDRDTRVVVFTGAGSAFCAGGDIPWLESVGDADAYAEIFQAGHTIVQDMLNLPQPIVAMVNGHAMGLGATLALMADITVMAEHARIGDPHVNVGIVAGDGGAAMWPLLLGPNRAKEFLMTGKSITGSEAAQLGLVNHAVPLEHLEETAYSLARQLAAGPRLAIQWTKRSVNLFVSQVMNTVIAGSLALEGLTFHTADKRNAVRAFLDRRK